jgi:tripartite-type tricarboxylate transporter receptor subunit TctC
MCRALHRLAVLASIAATALVSSADRSTAEMTAATWPQRMVHLIVPIGAGVGSDIAARQFAERLAEIWKQPVVVENRPGADTLVGTVAFVNAHDDHTLLYAPGAPISLFPYVHDKLSYDPAHDLVPIASATDTFVMLAATRSLNVGSLPDLVAYSRAHPGALNWASGGGALTYVLAGFAKSAGLDMVPVAYREQGRALQDLSAGRVHVMITVLATLQAQVAAGNVRLLAAVNDRRAQAAPDVPTVREAGFPEVEFDGMWGFFGSRGMPPKLRDRIAADVATVAANPMLGARLAAIGQIAHASTPAEFAAAIEAQRAKIASIVKLTGVNPMH